MEKEAFFKPIDPENPGNKNNKKNSYYNGSFVYGMWEEWSSKIDANENPFL